MFKERREKEFRIYIEDREKVIKKVMRKAMEVGDLFKANLEKGKLEELTRTEMWLEGYDEEALNH